MNSKHMKSQKTNKLIKELSSLSPVELVEILEYVPSMASEVDNYGQIVLYTGVYENDEGELSSPDSSEDEYNFVEDSELNEVEDV